MTDPATARADQADPEVVAFLMSHAEALTPLANSLSEQIHGIVKHAACSLPSVAAATILGVMVARQVLTESLSFVARSMEGDEGDAAAVMDAALAVFELTAPLMQEAKN